MTASAGSFDHLPRTPAGHLALHLHAVVFRLLDQLRRQGGGTDAALDAAFARFPFLGRWFDSVRERMPPDIAWDAVAGWWDATIPAWERGAEGHLPLRALSEQSGAPLAARLAFVAVGLLEEDARFGAVLADLQEPAGQRRPTVALLGRLLGAEGPLGAADGWSVCAPLAAAGLVEVLNEAAPRPEWILRVPAPLWDAARGRLPPALPWGRVLAADAAGELEGLVLPPGLGERVARAVSLLRTGRVRLLVLRAAPGGDAQQVAGAVARALGRAAVAVDGAALSGSPGPAALLGPLCALARAMPIVEHDLAPGDTATLPPLPGYAGPVVVTLGEQGGIASALSDASATIALPAPGPAERRHHWRAAIPEARIGALDRIVDAHRVGGGHIRTLARGAVAQAALDGRDAVTPDDVRAAAAALNRQLLDKLATPLPARGTWDDLVAGAGTRERLLELHRRCRHREDLADRLGPAFGATGPDGVRALLTGPSGTGKTLAARVLASVLGMELFRVDLAAVVNKYVGETEKNLHQVLARAEALDVVLLLDEGDALLGRRTEVRSANDRYANLETNYLLQRLEHYRGIVLVTTNQGEAIDAAFQRRMDVVVPFHPPRPDERLAILRLHLPERHEVSPALQERVAIRCAITGSQLRSAVLAATLLAVEQAAPLGDRHLEAALRSEYRKAGGICPLDAPLAAERDGGVGSFVAAFARS